MEHLLTRRQTLALAAAAVATAPFASALARSAAAEPIYRVSLAQWSLHRLLFDGAIDHLGFIAEARKLGFGAVEYVNSFFKDKAQDAAFLREMNTRAAGEGVEQLLIMCDGEGRLGDPSDAARLQAVDNHRRWLDAANALGCHSIRVNAASEGGYEEQQKLAADGLRRLAELGDAQGLNVIVENHGGLSSNGAWLAGVMKMVDHPRCGTLPDFGNFCMDWSRASEPEAWYDRYKGVGELMPFAKAVSAKSHEFDDAGNEVRTDYRRMIPIVLDAGYRGWIGVEYEGSQLDPRAGSIATRALLERVRDELTPRYRPSGMPESRSR